MVKVAIIGPHEIVQRVLEEGKSFSEIHFVPLPYMNEHEALGSSIYIGHQVDVILFTGPVPYRMVHEHKDKVKALLIWVNYGGTGLYRVLFQMTKDGFIQFTGENRFSIDFLNKEEVIGAFGELEINHNLQIIEFEKPMTSDRIVDYHVSLWQEGKVTCAITCLYSVYKKLSEMSIPAFCIVPTRLAIQDALNLALAKAKEKSFENNQIAICLISFDAGVQPEQKDKHLASISEILQTNWQMFSNESYLFYTTRGFIFSLTNGYTEAPYFMEQSSFWLFMGVGIGDTVIEATERARLAHDKSKLEEGSQMYIVENDNAVTRVHKEAGSRLLKYESRSYDELIRKIAAETGLSISTLSKIQYVANASSKRELSGAELARQLNITIRSARRILQSLVNEGYAEVTGGEQPFDRGRPRQIYKLRL
jgi:hypothetical protein